MNSSIAKLKFELTQLGWKRDRSRDSVIRYEAWTNGFGANHSHYRIVLISRAVFIKTTLFNKIILLAKKHPGNALWC